MRIASNAPPLLTRAVGALSCLLLVAALPLAAAKSPQPVSPGAIAKGSAVEARCPTFQWAGIAGARGYELAVFELSEDDGAEPRLVSRASVPGDARGFTLSSSDCLERGGRYAWSIAAASGAADDLQWSAPYLFEVQSAPTLEELEQAIATIERYREHGLGDVPVAADRAPRSATGARAEQVRTRSPLDPRASTDLLPGALTSPTSGVTRVASASAPVPGENSLSVSANIALGAASNVFKNDESFLWDDDTGNTALGRNALASASAYALGNTAVGRDALRNNTVLDDTTPSYSDFNTAVGHEALKANTYGFKNTATGYRALFSNTTGNRNTAIGEQALRNNQIGNVNTAIGSKALYSGTQITHNVAIGYNTMSALTTGFRNTAVGSPAGNGLTTGDDNVFLGSGANATAFTETKTIRIGGQGNQTRTFIAGIHGVTTGSPTTVPVLVDANGQLGQAGASSLAAKQDIQGLGTLADRLLELRPVAFRYKQHAASNPDGPLQFGLIAEEVAEVLPELVVYDQDGKPRSVKYHLLSSLLLGELQKQHGELSDQRQLSAQQQAELEQQQAALARLQARLEAVESKSSEGPGGPEAPEQVSTGRGEG